MVFIAAGMGGDTGTGAAPVIAEIASGRGSLTVAVVTKPFEFELQKRMQVAVEGIGELNRHVDALITIPNEKLITVLGEDRPLTDAFREADGVLSGAVQGIAELITNRGLINLDFADIKTVMMKTGMAMMGCGRAEGENRAYNAAQAAINNPLLEDVDLSNACGLLVNIMSNPSLTTGEIKTIGQCMSELASSDATVVTGTVINEDMDDSIRVTLIATGLGDSKPDAGNSDVADEAQPESVVAWPNKEQAASGSNGDGQYEAPAIERRGTVCDTRGERKRRKQDEDAGNEPSYLDIPAFLRHQMD
jgi:cell division protein FtsZ